MGAYTKQHVGKNWLNKDTDGNTWETRRILGPKSENIRNEERSEESAGKDYAYGSKEGRKGKRRKTILSVPNAGEGRKWREDKETSWRQVGR